MNKDNGKEKNICKNRKKFRSSRSKLVLIYCEFFLEAIAADGDRFVLFYYLGIVFFLVNLFCFDQNTQQWHNLLALTHRHFEWNGIEIGMIKCGFINAIKLQSV